jgi:hypothetical protein
VFRLKKSLNYVRPEAFTSIVSDKILLDYQCHHCVFMQSEVTEKVDFRLQTDAAGSPSRFCTIM